ncbi:MAG TPA: YggS family pyridoxal phosphate-dependent enzyme [Treponema sp.]|nr:YggS family pyridoxal phosphate-dependent enzyme [Treponema sp.]
MKSVDVKVNLEKIKNSISDAERLSGRAEGSVKLLAVSKFHPAQSVVDALNAGQTMFGENRVQEACSKFEEICKAHPETELHIIGTLQKNKVGRAVKICSCIESVDRLELIQEIEKYSLLNNKTIRVLFEYHTGEESKSGFTSYESLQEAVKYCAEGKSPHVLPSGFMTMAPFTQDEKAIHASFAGLRKTAERLRREFPQFALGTLSMGMSGDYRIAIAEGSTEVRIGTAIFGEREYPAA